MNYLFLMAALALPPTFQQHPILSASAESESLRWLKDFIEKSAPGAEVLITPPFTSMPDWERFPMNWNNQWVWIKRKPVYDIHIPGIPDSYFKKDA